MKKTRLLVINPNSSPEMTADIDKNVQTLAHEQLEIVTMPTPGAAPFIATYEDQFSSAAGMLELVRTYQDSFDAFIIACHADPNLDLLKEASPKPVVGIAEASMKLATMLGHSFSVIGPVDKSSANKAALVDKYGLKRDLASIRAADLEGDESLEDRLVSAGRRAISEDKAEVLVLGCAGFAGLDKRMSQVLQVPVLDGITCAVIIATGLVNYGLNISRIRRYKVGSFSL